MITSIAVSANGMMYAGTQGSGKYGSGVYRSTDGGESWTYQRANNNARIWENETGLFGKDIVASQVKTSDLVPSRYALPQNYPNPFNPSTTIEFQLPAATRRMMLLK